MMNNKRVCIINQDSAGISQFDDMTTIGCGPCIGICGIASAKDVSTHSIVKFLAHFSSVETTISATPYFYRVSYLSDPHRSVTIYLVGGYRGLSEHIRDVCAERIRYAFANFAKFKIIDASCKQSIDRSTSVIIKNTGCYEYKITFDEIFDDDKVALNSQLIIYGLSKVKLVCDINYCNTQRLPFSYKMCGVLITENYLPNKVIFNETFDDAPLKYVNLISTRDEKKLMRYINDNTKKQTHNNKPMLSSNKYVPTKQQYPKNFRFTKQYR